MAITCEGEREKRRKKFSPRRARSLWENIWKRRAKRTNARIINKICTLSQDAGRRAQTLTSRRASEGPWLVESLVLPRLLRVFPLHVPSIFSMPFLLWLPPPALYVYFCRLAYDGSWFEANTVTHLAGKHVAAADAATEARLGNRKITENVKMSAEW